MAHSFEFSALLTQEHFARIAQDNERRYAFLKRNSVAFCEIEIGVVLPTLMCTST